VEEIFVSETAKFAHVVLAGVSGANAGFNFIEPDPAGECGNSSEFVTALQNTKRRSATKRRCAWPKGRDD